MIAVIAGDVIGSVHEHPLRKSTDFPPVRSTLPIHRGRRPDRREGLGSSQWNAL